MIPRRAAVGLVAALLGVAACASEAAQDCPRCPEPTELPPPVVVKPAKPPVDAPAPEHERRQELAFYGFSKDGAKFCLEVQDEFMGEVLQVFDAATQKIVDSQVTTSFTRAAALKKLAKKHGLVALAQGSARRPGGELSLVGGDSADWLVVYAQEGERSVPYFRVPRIVDGDRVADAAVSRILWSPNGQYAVLLSHQELAAPFAFAGDFVHVIPYDAGRLPF